MRRQRRDTTGVAICNPCAAGYAGVYCESCAAQFHRDLNGNCVGDYVCPDHGEPPTVICSGTRLDNLRFEVKGCCQKMIYKVKSKLEE